MIIKSEFRLSDRKTGFVIDEDIQGTPIVVRCARCGAAPGERCFKWNGAYWKTTDVFCKARYQRLNGERITCKPLVVVLPVQSDEEYRQELEAALPKKIVAKTKKPLIKKAQEKEHPTYRCEKGAHWYYSETSRKGFRSCWDCNRKG